jgi:hypothetical protein
MEIDDRRKKSIYGNIAPHVILNRYLGGENPAGICSDIGE